jgi:hypothetical protein
VPPTTATPSAEDREHVAGARGLVIHGALIDDSGDRSVENQIEDIENKKDDKSVE